jgi:putative hydrolase
MNIEVDTHTHTVLSGHAHSTLLENAAAAAKKGLKGFVLTDHGPNLPGACPGFNLGTYPFLPSHIEGVRVYPGVESNIIDFSGTIDVSKKYIKFTDYVIAGLHEVVIKPGTKAQNTQAVFGAFSNPYVDIIAHPDNASYELDYEAVVKEAARLNKLLEVNNHSFSYRKGGIANAGIYLPLCRKYGVRVAVSSDAHFASHIGGHNIADGIIEELAFPHELIVNLTMQRFESYLLERKTRIEAHS